jgi:hypothetical protein
MNPPKRTPLKFLPTIADHDAAKRISGAVNVHVVGAPWDAVGKWMAFRLSDGGSDNVLYGTKADAVRFQLHETQCFYLNLTPDGITEDNALRLLHYNRQAKAAGYDLSTDATPVHNLNRRN